MGLGDKPSVGGLVDLDLVVVMAGGSVLLLLLVETLPPGRERPDRSCLAAADDGATSWTVTSSGSRTGSCVLSDPHATPTAHCTITFSRTAPLALCVSNTPASWHDEIRFRTTSDAPWRSITTPQPCTCTISLSSSTPRPFSLDTTPTASSVMTFWVAVGCAWDSIRMPQVLFREM